MENVLDAFNPRTVVNAMDAVLRQAALGGNAFKSQSLFREIEVCDLFLVTWWVVENTCLGLQSIVRTMKEHNIVWSNVRLS